MWLASLISAWWLFTGAATILDGSGSTVTDACRVQLDAMAAGVPRRWSGEAEVAEVAEVTEKRVGL